MPFYTPLRYPGGKGQLGPWLADVIAHNGLSSGTYVEPYAGGAGAALHLLSEGHIERVVINDVDPAVHAFWWSALNDTDRLLQRIQATPITLEERERQRSILSNPSSSTVADLGFAAFFLNRTSRSGILAGGAIGGKSQSGKYRLDARFNREDLSQRIAHIGTMRERIELHNKDAMELLNVLKRRRFSRNSLIYLDPPYYVKGAQLYRNYYSPQDHRAIAERVMDIRTPWVVTYDNCSPIRSLYRAVNDLEFSLYYSTHKSRAATTEVMFYGNLDIPSLPYLRRASPQTVKVQSALTHHQEISSGEVTGPPR